MVTQSDVLSFHQTLVGDLLDEVSAWQQFERAKHRQATLEAEVEIAVRRQACEAGEKVTEGAVAARVATDPAVEQGRFLLIEHETNLRYKRAWGEATRFLAKLLEAQARAEVAA